MANESETIINACEIEWDSWKGDCSGFVKAVGTRLGITLSGNANALIDYLGHSPEWQNLDAQPKAATIRANQGYFVIGGLKAQPHGHVVVVVRSGASLYPVAYWGRFGAVGKKKTTINFSWAHPQLANVLFFARQL
jgi:hypothetical protein